jgi:hypothetical protein
MRLEQIEIVLVGDSPLICHAWSKKAREIIDGKQRKQARGAKEARDPEAEYLASLYYIQGGGYGFPAGGLKAAAVDACSFVDGITKVVARGAFHIMSTTYDVVSAMPVLPILGAEPVMREDMVRIGMGTADIRYRAQFVGWRISVPIWYNGGVLSADQIVNLFNVAGFAVGIGDWRPQRDGSFGTFHVGGGQ